MTNTNKEDLKIDNIHKLLTTKTVSLSRQTNLTKLTHYNQGQTNSYEDTNKGLEPNLTTMSNNYYA